MKQVKLRSSLRAAVLIMGLLLSVGSFAQKITVQGHVTDGTGEGIIGATVRAAGASGGVITDFDGNFTIEANQGDELSISYIGYETAKVLAKPTLNVVLKDEAATSLNEVVVIGYGAVKKKDLTGSVTAIRPDSKNKGVVVNAQDMLAGKVAGVTVATSTGEPGAGNTIRIRGGSSLNASNDPLIVIDGVPMDNNKVKGGNNLLSTINPQDIESFNVLKDASAAAIYGSRGSNGVIIITTKKGRAGQAPTISYAGSATVSIKKKTIDMMNGDEFRALVKEQCGEGSDAYLKLGTANTDWQDEIYRTAFSHDHNVTVSGAVGKALPYRVSLGYTGQDGILKTSNYQRYTASVNLNPSFLQDHLTLNLNAKGMYSKARQADGGAIGAAVLYDPTQSPYDFTSQYDLNQLGANKEQTLKNFGGYYQWLTSASAYKDPQWAFTRFSDATKNPLSMLYSQKNMQRMRSFIGSADVDYKVHGFEDLRLHATLGAEIASGKENGNYPTYHPANMYYGGHANNTNFKRNLLLSAYAQYFHDFNDKAKNHFDIMAGYEWQHFFFRYNNDWMQYYPETNAMAGQEYNHTQDFDKRENYLVSFFGRANWSLMDRYYVTVTVRDDGSSRFEDHWSVFPSVAFAWNMKDENNLRDIKWLSDLKLRLGWGMTGQQDVGDCYGWIDNYSYGVGNKNHYPAAGDGTICRPGNVNHKLKWETTTTYNVGLDWGILNHRLTGSLDWYFRKTKDLINWAPWGALAAFGDEGNQNIGSLKNTGIEASISWKAITTKDFYWTIDYNFTYNKNEITDLSGVSQNGLPVKTGDNVDQTNKVLAHQVGKPANSFYVFQQIYDVNGKPIEGAVVDRNGDGKITDEDRYMYKCMTAPVTMGLSSRMEYKNWDLCFTMRASLGNYLYNRVQKDGRITTSNDIFRQSCFLENRPVNSLGWKNNDVTTMLTDYFVQNASYLKMDNITLGYSFQNLFKSSGFKGLSGRVYGTCTNVFTITKYDGLDPEVEGGIDNNVYPRPMSFILGLNLTF